MAVIQARLKDKNCEKITVRKNPENFGIFVFQKLWSVENNGYRRYRENYRRVLSANRVDKKYNLCFSIKRSLNFPNVFNQKEAMDEEEKQNDQSSFQ